MRIFAQIIAKITGTPRCQVQRGVDFEFSYLWTHNFFRVYEYLFGRRFGIRAEMSAGHLEDGRHYQTAHSWEAACVLAEIAIRDALSFKWSRLPVKIWIPIMQTPEGFNIPASPYLFAIALDTSVDAGLATASANTYNHTTTGSNILLVGYSFFGGGSGATFTSTYDGNALTQIATSQQGSDPNPMVMHYATNVGASTKAMSVSCSAAGSDSYAASASYSGVLGGLDNSTTTSNTGLTSKTTTLTTIADNCWTVLGSRWSGNTISAGTGATTRTNGTSTAIHSASALWLGDSNGVVHPAGNKSMTITQGAAGDNVGTIMASFSPTAPIPPVPLTLPTINALKINDF